MSHGGRLGEDMMETAVNIYPAGGTNQKGHTFKIKVTMRELNGALVTYNIWSHLLAEYLALWTVEKRQRFVKVEGASW